MKNTVVLSVIVFFIFEILLLIFYSKQEFHLLVNDLHTGFADKFFFYITFLGDGFFALFVILSGLLIRYRTAVKLALSYAVSSLIVQVLKHLVFSDVMRPVKYFQEININLNLVDGVNYHSFLSFPSGHSASAFSIFILIGLMVKNRYFKIAFVLLAFVVAFSRVYLSQHFLVDIFAGSFIGFVTAYCSNLLVDKWDKSWLDKSLIKK